MQPVQRIGIEELRRRRQRVLDELDGAVGVVFAGEGGSHLVGRWRAHPHFVYLTGIDDEPGAAVLFDGANPDPLKRCVLVLRPRDPEMETWDGLRESITAEFRSRTGFDKVVRTTYLPRFLTAAARRSKRLACMHPFAAYTAPVSPDLELFRKIAERIVGVQIEDRSELLAQLRSVKSEAELALMKQAMAATADAFTQAARAIRPGVNEREIHVLLERVFAEHGASGPAYNTIVGAGVNSTVLHYNANDQAIHDGDMICIDAGASLGDYAADVTRTFPASGRFTSRQREVYETVLRAQEAAIEACKPGAWLHEVDAAARAVIDDAGFGDTYVHGIGHHLGLEVHDAMPDAPLSAGNVVTIEPGVYLREEKIGVRIEDDILITRSGHENLTSMIPKRADDVEAWMREEA